MTVSGIDVSRWQSSTPNLAGLSFLFARATYGTYPDIRYGMHIANARQAGLLVGAYAFGVNASVTAQVNAFLRAAGNVDFYVLDLESDGSRARMTDGQARAFIASVKAKGKRIGLYHSASGFPFLGQDYNWVAKWSPTPPTQHWTFWQQAGTTVDRDVFNGSVTALRQLAHVPPLPFAIRYRVSISGYTNIFLAPNGRRTGAVSAATYICTRAKVSGEWWYRILTKSDGTATANRYRYFQPNGHVIARYA